jgi:DNA primase
VAAGNPLEFDSAQVWITKVLEQAPDDEIKSHVRAMAVEPLPNDIPDERYVQAVLARILEMDAGRRVAEIKAALSRAEDGTDEVDQARLLTDLLSLESYRRDMRNFAIGDI